MKDEIKEIITRMASYTIHYDCCSEGDAEEDIDKVLDYITNLEEENERLNNIIEELENFDSEYTIKKLTEGNTLLSNTIIDLTREKDIYKSRNEKAVEFVKKESKKCYSNQTTDDPQKVIGNFMWHTDKLLNILNGGDKDE